MDILEQVREIGQDVPPITDPKLDEARQKLLRETARKQRPSVRKPVRRRLIGGSVVIAGLAAAALVAGIVLAPPHPEAAAAAAVLRQTANVTVHAVDTTLTSGQYLRIADTTTYSGDPDPKAGGGTGTSPGSSTLVLYIPADRTKDWFLQLGPDSRGPEKVERMPSGEDGPLTPQQRDRGKFTNSIDPWRPYYAEMPRDPKALLNWFRARGEASQGYDWVMSMFSDPLTTALMPPDLRAATFRALALIPGIKVVAQNGSVVTLQRADTTHARVATIVVDTATGFIRSYTTESRDLSGTTVTDAQSISMSVVDQAPTPTS
ncbi:hypothetical protein GCM10027414_32600 [Humibacter ginsengiterrae]